MFLHELCSGLSACDEGKLATDYRDSYYIDTAEPKAGMAELADAADSKSADRKVVGVRPPLPAPFKLFINNRVIALISKYPCRVQLIELPMLLPYHFVAFPLGCGSISIQVTS